MNVNKNVCYFCGEYANSVQHFPAKYFFPKNMRKNLITVSSCQKHNQGLQLLEERILISFFTQLTSSKIANNHFFNNIRPDLERKERKYFLNSIVDKYDPKNNTMEINMSEINDYMRYLISGLYFYHTNKVNKDEIRILCNKTDPDTFNIALFGLSINKTMNIGNVSNKEIFNYKYFINNYSHWHCIFYEEVEMLGIIKHEL